MTRYLKRDRRRTTAFFCILLAAAVTWTVGAQQPAPAGDQAAAGQAANFTGGKVTVLKPEGRLSWYVLGPGARTKWHSHEGGQLILAEEGRGRIQIRGQAVRELRQGEIDVVAPGCHALARRGSGLRGQALSGQSRSNDLARRSPRHRLPKRTVVAVNERRESI